MRVSRLSSLGPCGWPLKPSVDPKTINEPFFRFLVYPLLLTIVQPACGSQCATPVMAPPSVSAFPLLKALSVTSLATSAAPVPF